MRSIELQVHMIRHCIMLSFQHFGSSFMWKSEVMNGPAILGTLHGRWAWFSIWKERWAIKESKEVFYILFLTCYHAIFQHFGSSNIQLSVAMTLLF